jgi:CRP-like cAMP-binding protein
MPTLRDHGVPTDNRLLAALPREEYERLSPHLESFHLTPGKILYNAGEAVRHAYFPKSGVVSLLSITEEGRTIEVGMIGNEGMVGIPIILRSDLAPYQVVVQLAGDALRVRGAALRAEFNRGGGLQDLLLRYTHSLLIQVTQAAACNRFHTVQERLCRRLLVSRDRVQSDTLQLTQESLSHMLGVPRTSVTMIAGDLQKEGLIRCGRGRITILDRALLEAASCECYERARGD